MSQKKIRNVEELDQFLSNPSDALRKDLGNLPGDILILGAGGKMGPSLAMLAKRAAPDKKIFAVSRFSDNQVKSQLEVQGIDTVAGDLLSEEFLRSLPVVPNIIFMAGQKFGTTGKEPYTWAMNSYLPGRIAERSAVALERR